ncbi:MAG: hypothetical protein J4N95_07635, partial [Chloroflexi bacterium]|nr:hypothetical protein [Chloroflexota bacterium]
MFRRRDEGGLIVMPYMQLSDPVPVHSFEAIGRSLDEQGVASPPEFDDLVEEMEDVDLSDAFASGYQAAAKRAPAKRAPAKRKTAKRKTAKRKTAKKAPAKRKTA